MGVNIKEMFNCTYENFYPGEEREREREREKLN
jgi:hypothetical protein